jgi:general secretion pathway protein H
MSQPTPPHRKGFSLIELTVAMGVIAVMFAMVVYSIGSLTGAKAKQSATQLAGVIRNLYDTAALTGKTCRLVFQMPQEREEGTLARYRAECAKGAVTAAAKRDDELSQDNVKQRDRDRESEAQRRFRRLDDEAAATNENLAVQEKKRVEDAAKFDRFASDEVNEVQLPSGVSLEVWTQKQRAPVKNGLAYLYFFPQGFTEKAQVVVRQGSNAWTLTVSSLTGKTVIHTGQLELPR